MQNHLIAQFEERMFPKTRTHPKFRPGDTIRVKYKIEESAKAAGGEKKFRIQTFEGVCIRFKKGSVESSFTVRKVAANSVGVERIFPLSSPYVDSIEILAGGKVRQARLYYLRDLRGKSARIRSRRLPSDTMMETVIHSSDAAAHTAIDNSENKKKKKKK
ncbi:MAG: 50S ribosomal protein L19 [Deltaproteobacteria bacterium]|nr:50S ribosomal protein L19 [Deltaproteobacteria bacterium]